MENKIVTVTSPLLPNLNEFKSLLEKNWISKWITNAFTHMQAGTIIKSNVVILSGVNISHNTIGEYCFVAGGATIGAYTMVGCNVFYGQGTLRILNKVKTIGNGALIGTVALLTHSVPERAVVCGSPAKIIRYLKALINYFIKWEKNVR